MRWEFNGEERKLFFLGGGRYSFSHRNVSLNILLYVSELMKHKQHSIHNLQDSINSNICMSERQTRPDIHSSSVPECAVQVEF